MAKKVSGKKESAGSSHEENSRENAQQGHEHNHVPEHADAQPSEQESQEKMIRAQLLEQEARQIQEQLGLIDRQLVEFQLLSLHLDDINNFKQGDEILAPIGKGIFLNTELKGKQLFVDIGSKVVVKKSAKDVKEIIEKDIQKLNEARNKVSKDLDTVLQEIIKMQSFG